MQGCCTGRALSSLANDSDASPSDHPGHHGDLSSARGVDGYQPESCSCMVRCHEATDMDNDGCADSE